mgnify:CR=1 FL=1
MLRMLREEKPVPVPAVQFSGGEPTMRDDLPELVLKAKELGLTPQAIARYAVEAIVADEPALTESSVEQT